MCFGFLEMEGGKDRGREREREEYRKERGRREDEIFTDSQWAIPKKAIWTREAARQMSRFHFCLIPGDQGHGPHGGV